MREFVHPSRHRLRPADPNFVQGPVLCPNPACEGGTEELVMTDGSLTRFEVRCLVCKGESIVTNESDIADVMAWAYARRILVKLHVPD